MMTLRNTVGSKLLHTLLVLLTVSILLLPSNVRAADRNGTVLFFPLEDLQQLIVHPSRQSLAQLFSFSSSTPSFGWQSWSTEPDNPGKRETYYENGSYGDGYRVPGPHSWWGY